MQKEGKDEWRSKQRDGGESGEPSFWLSLLSVGAEMSERRDILPHSFPAARPLFGNTTPSAADNTNKEAMAERANKPCSQRTACSTASTLTPLRQFSKCLSMGSICHGLVGTETML